MAEIDRETRELVHLPKRLVDRFSNRAVKVLVLAVVVMLFFGLGGVAVRAVQTWIAQQTEPERREKHLAQLDQLADAREYEEIWEYLDEYDLYESVYQEYSDLYFASYGLYYVEEFHQYIERGGVWESTLGWTVSEVTLGIMDIDQMLEERVYVRGVDEIMKEIREELITLLTEDLGMTQDELQQAKELCVELAEEEDYEKRIAAFAQIGVAAAKRQGIRILAEDETLDG